MALIQGMENANKTRVRFHRHANGGFLEGLKRWPTGRGEDLTRPCGPFVACDCSSARSSALITRWFVGLILRNARCVRELLLQRLPASQTALSEIAAVPVRRPHRTFVLESVSLAFRPSPPSPRNFQREWRRPNGWRPRSSCAHDS